MRLSFKRIVILLISFCFLIFSTLISWYEGAQLLDTPWEWKYSAIFSTWLNGEVHSASDILEIDHFVYAAKFAPLFPFLMVSASLVIFLILVDWLFKGEKRVLYSVYFIAGVLFFCASGVLSASPTAGLSFFAIYFGVVGFVLILRVFLYGMKVRGCKVFAR